jgi:hypothetical protein
MVGKPNVRDGRMRVRILSNRIFTHRCLPSSRRGHFNADLLRPRQQHLVCGDLNLLEAVLTEVIARPLGELTIARGSSEVRLVGEKTMGVADPVGGWQREEALLEIALTIGMLAREAQERRV